MASGKRGKNRKPGDERIYLLHADELMFDQYGRVPGAQIVKGHVRFRNGGAHLNCDSAYFFQESNSVKAFGHVYFNSADTMTLRCNYAEYDGMAQMMRARHNVVVRHRTQTLITDSLDYDRLWNFVNYFEGGVLHDGKDKLVSDWGRYDLGTKEAVFYYNVRLRTKTDLIKTDTLYYDVARREAHLVGASVIEGKDRTVFTDNGYYDTRSDRARLYGRSKIIEQDRSITGDTLLYLKDGESEAYGRVRYADEKRKNALHCGYLRYNDKTGMGFATRRPTAYEFSKGDTLYLHSDTMRIYTFNINTDSVYRRVHAYPHMQAFRRDVQAVSDSAVFSSLDSCLTMYRDPIVWNQNRQLLGEVIKVYMNDSTVRLANVIGQALAIEQMPDSTHYNQITSKLMNAYFDTQGNLRMNENIGNVQSVYYPISDKDSSIIGLNYLETDTMRMYMSPQRRLQKIWMPKTDGTMYPITQIPPDKYKLPNFQWFDAIRPKDKDDIYIWKGKGDENKLKKIVRHEAPLQKLSN